MRCKHFQMLLFVALVAAFNAAPAPAQEPQSDDDEITVRGAFLTTRPVAATKETKKGAGETAAPAARKSAPAGSANNSVAGARKSGAKSSGNATARKGAKDSPRDEIASVNRKSSGSVEAGVTDDAAMKARPLALGYTLFTRDENGEAVRTNPARQFRTGEAIRIALEANTDGYLYIFHTEGGGAPQMIFPDTRLNKGVNLVRAHVPYEIPSSEEVSESLRWFIFKDPPADERLYVVLTREPLPNVPTDEALAAYCVDTRHTCPWRPATKTWAQLKGEQGREQVAVSKIQDQGRPQTSTERDATTRGLGLSPGAPPPSIIRMTASSNTGILVTAIDLVHK